ncbi:Hpt domain-containing protein [Oleidesulfovibrio sp.]|uniref:Hpt domain-containing protein n=1 Tax=Oleidesulfovibrio sp. TaxID=2909707 RepID=UPI003A84DB54
MKCIDYEKLYSRFGDKDLIRTMLGIFIGDFDERLAKMKTLSESSDFNGLYKASHALKGAAGTIGASQLAFCAATLENAATEGKEDSIRQAWSALIDEADCVKSEVEIILHEAGMTSS